MKYYLATFLLALIGSPIAVSIGMLGAVFVFPPIMMLMLLWLRHARKADLPDSMFKAILPIVAAFCYYMLMWVLVFGFSHYHFGNRLFESVYLIAAMPYLFINLIFNLNGDYSLFPVLQAAVLVVTLLIVFYSCKANEKSLKFDKNVLICLLPALCLSLVAAYQYFDRTTKVLSDDYSIERVEDEVNLYNYHPFSDDNRLHTLSDAAIAIDSNYPKLDGATAAYPVYGAIVQSIYKGLDDQSVYDYVKCTKTNEAYERLIVGEIDIFFGAQPSRQHLAMAKEKGVELTLTPIAKEAFVFFVNRENPIDSLTSEQIQDIYLKEITNWKELGGNDEKIMPFQRPENSGSQTIMLAKVMNGKALPPPLWEEYAGGMGGVISQVATYRNYSSAIGYSFRYFATGMMPNDNIKLLSINGIKPTIENIRNGTYPFTIDTYAVTAGTANENVTRLIDWIISEQGQNFIEECGYVQTLRREPIYYLTTLAVKVRV